MKTTFLTDGAAPCAPGVTPAGVLLEGTAVPFAARLRTDALGVVAVDAPPPRGAPV